MRSMMRASFGSRSRRWSMAGWCMPKRSAVAAKLASHHFQVANEFLHCEGAGLGIRRAEYGGGMDGRHDDLRVLRPDRLAALFRHTERLAEEGLRRGRAETDDDLRLDERDLEIEPEAASGDLHRVGLLVDAALAALG